MKKILLILLVASAALPASSQNVGLSFSYFIPRNGYFSTPISPFSIRGLGVNINKYLALQTGASLYRMSGLNMRDLPIQSKSPFVGPNFTLYVPAELVIQLKGNNVEFDIKGGGFFFYGFDQHLNNGNIDEAFRKSSGWAVANSSLSFQNNPGFGYQAGAELTVYVTSQLGISLEANYLAGQSRMPLTGSFSGGTTTISTLPVDYKDAKLDFTGMEFSIGLIFNSGNGGKSKPKARRRR